MPLFAHHQLPLGVVHSSVFMITAFRNIYFFYVCCIFKRGGGGVLCCRAMDQRFPFYGKLLHAILLLDSGYSLQPRTILNTGVGNPLFHITPYGKFSESKH